MAFPPAGFDWVFPDLPLAGSAYAIAFAPAAIDFTMLW